MKLTFLQKLFGATEYEGKPVSINDIPEGEVNNLIDAAVDELIMDENNNKVNKQIDVYPVPVIQAKNSTSKVSSKTITNFHIVKEVDNSTFEVDKTNGISRITWNGTVSIETVRKLVTLGANSVEFHGYKKLLLDRSNLVEFDTEARIWIKEFLKTRARKIVKMVERLAIVKPTSAKGNIFSNFIGSAISIVMPNLEMKNFDKLDEAVEWLT